MPEFDSNNNMVWPIPFAQPTQNRASGGAVSDASQLPWLIGIDGRSRGTIEPFPGVKEIGFPPTEYTTSFTVTNYAWVGTTHITFGGVDFSINLVPSGSNNQAAIDAAAGINALTATYPWMTATVAGPVVTLHWNTGYGFGAFTGGATGGGVSPSGAATMTAVYAGDSATTLTAHYIKYLTMRLGTGQLLRGYIVHRYTTDDIIYVYKLGSGGEAFTDYITIQTGASSHKVGATGGGRVGYVVASATNIGGTSYSKAIVSSTNTAGALLKIYDMATSGATSTIGEPEEGTVAAGNGVLKEGYYLWGYRYYDSIRRRYSPLSTLLLNAGAVNDSDAINIYSNGHNVPSNDPDPFLPITNTKGAWDYVEFFSSVSNGDTANRYANLPVFSRGLKAISNDYWGWAAAWQYGTAGKDDYLTDEGAVYTGDPWSADTDYVNTTLPQMEDIAFFGGSNFAIEPENELLNIRWTPLHRIEPENFPPLNSRRTAIPSNGSAHFCPAGDFLWLLGDGESYRIQKVGSKMSCFRMLEGVSVVGCRASVAVGGDIYAVTTQGLLQINAETGDYTQVAAADRIILKRWSKNLRDSSPTEPRIFAAHDARLGTVTIWNKSAGEAIILWLTTGRVTYLTDMWYEYMTTGRTPNDITGGNVTVLLSKIADGAITRSTGGLFLCFADYRSATPNMMGVAADNQIITSLRLQPVDVSLSGGNTAITFAANSGYDKYADRGPVTGGVLYDLTANPIVGYKILDSDYVTAAAPIYRFRVWVAGDVTASITTSSIISICPVVMAVCGPPLSGLYAGDMLSRRVVSYIGAVISDSSDNFETSSDPILEYWTTRMQDVGDETILDAIGTASPMTVAARNLPFSATFPIAKSGTSVSFDPSTPSLLQAEVTGDGGILYPAVRFLRSGQWVAIPGLFVMGRVNPNTGIESV